MFFFLWHFSVNFWQEFIWAKSESTKFKKNYISTRKSFVNYLLSANYMNFTVKSI